MTYLHKYGRIIIRKRGDINEYLKDKSLNHIKDINLKSKIIKIEEELSYAKNSTYYDILLKDKLNATYCFEFYIKKLNISGKIYPYVNIKNLINEKDINLIKQFIFTQCYNHILDCISSYFLKGDFRNYEELQAKL